jgi:hypothetical protein
LRLVAADASTMRCGLRASHVKRAALPDKILFGLFLPGAELMLAASLHGIEECGERQMLVQHLDRLSSDDLLLLDRGYPSRWLVSLLKHSAFRSASGSKRQATAVSPACARFCAPALMNRSSRSTHPSGATLMTTNARANPSRFVWFAMSRQTARCAC